MAWWPGWRVTDIRFEGWATPGGSLHGAALDLARTTCRRSERRIWGLVEAGSPVNPLSTKYLNRLSDVLWLLARRDESKLGGIRVERGGLRGSGLDS